MFQSVELKGRHARLVPLGPEHEQGLGEAIRDGDLWDLHVTLVPRPDQLAAFIEAAMKMHNAGDGLAFATIEESTGRVAGSTRFMKYHEGYRRVEIGYTFLGLHWQRTPLNTEAKLLMLMHAFEHLGLNRVEFLTDYLNLKSRAAILRLGAKEEGVLRNHMVMPDGRVRDSVVFSVIRNEWPGVKQHLRSKLT